MNDEHNGHGNSATPKNETHNARFPLPNPPPGGEGANESLREFQVNDKPATSESKFGQQVGEMAALKLRAQRRTTQTVCSGLGMMGLVGWSVAVPTLLGAALGIWIDKHYPGSHSWTLALLVIGLCLGCFNAWHWVSKEDKEIHNDGNDHD